MMICRGHTIGVALAGKAPACATTGLEDTCTVPALKDYLEKVISWNESDVQVDAYLDVDSSLCFYMKLICVVIKKQSTNEFMTNSVQEYKECCM